MADHANSPNPKIRKQRIRGATQPNLRSICERSVAVRGVAHSVTQSPKGAKCVISLGLKFAGGDGGIFAFLSMWGWRLHEIYERIAFNQSKCCRYLMA